MHSFRAAFVSLCFACVADAQFVPGVTATTNMGTWFTSSLANLTNGAGLSSLSVTGTHAANWQDMWTSDLITTGWLLFDLQSVVPLSTIAVWNYNGPGALVRGVAQMNVSTSPDAITFTPLWSGSLPQGTGQPLLPYLLQGNGVAARYVRFDVLSNHGDNVTGLSEVQFVAGAGVTVATYASLGQGCGRHATSFYESFATAASFDLGSSGFAMSPIGSGYVVTPGAVFVLPSPTAAVLPLTNNSEVAVTLSSPFPHATGSTTSLTVCSNGYVSIASGNGVGSLPTAAFLLFAPRTAWFVAHDYDPALAGGGRVKFEEHGGVAYITWDGVRDALGSSFQQASTFQFQFDTTSGAVRVAMQSMSAYGSGYLVGYSPGGPSDDPGSTDLSAASSMPLVLAAADVLPLALDGVTRPIVNTTWALNVTNVPAAGVIGIDVFGAADPGIVDLGSLGAPGCGWRATLDVLNVWPVVGASHGHGLALPNAPSLVGRHLFTQALVLQPGANTLLGGVITSNGIDGTIGDL